MCISLKRDLKNVWFFVNKQQQWNGAVSRQNNKPELLKLVGLLSNIWASRLLINWQMTCMMIVHNIWPNSPKEKDNFKSVFLFWFSLVCFYGSGLWLFLVPDCLVAIKQSNFMSNALKTFELKVLQVTSIQSKSEHILFKRSDHFIGVKIMIIKKRGIWYWQPTAYYRVTAKFGAA